jgi:hypothetical protein
MKSGQGPTEGCRSIDGWMDGSMDGWVVGWMDGWMDVLAQRSIFIPQYIFLICNRHDHLNRNASALIKLN